MNLSQMTAVVLGRVEIRVCINFVSRVRGGCFDRLVVERLTLKCSLHCRGAISLRCHASNTHGRGFTGAIRRNLQSNGYAHDCETGNRVPHLLVSMAETPGRFKNTDLA